MFYEERNNEFPSSIILCKIIGLHYATLFVK
jgi:hypothetical protein